MNDAHRASIREAVEQRPSKQGAEREPQLLPSPQRYWLDAPHEEPRTCFVKESDYAEMRAILTRIQLERDLHRNEASRLRKALEKIAHPEQGVRPQDKEPFLKGFVPLDRRTALEALQADGASDEPSDALAEAELHAWRRAHPNTRYCAAHGGLITETVIHAVSATDAAEKVSALDSWERFCKRMEIEQPPEPPSAWREGRPPNDAGSYLVACATGQVAPYIRGIIRNNVGTPWDWNYGEAISHWMPLPGAPVTKTEAPKSPYQTIACNHEKYSKGSTLVQKANKEGIAVYECTQCTWGTPLSGDAHETSDGDKK